MRTKTIRIISIVLAALMAGSTFFGVISALVH